MLERARQQAVRLDLDGLSLGVEAAHRDAPVETQKRAIALIPKGSDTTAVAEMTDILRTFEAALAETDKPPADGGDR